MLIYQIYFGSETTIIDHGSESFLINVKQWHPAKFTNSAYRTADSARDSRVVLALAVAGGLLPLLYNRAASTTSC